MNRPSSLFESFEQLARSGPAKLAVSEGAAPGRLTRRQLLGRVRDLSSVLQQGGFRAGDVALCHGAGLPFVVALLALWARDGVALLADESLTDGELASIEARLAPAWHVRAAGAVPPLPARRESRRPPRLPAGAAVLKLTSGSTGEPRAIAVTADELRADAAQILSGMRITPDDTNVGVVPMSHSYGLGSLVLPLVVQGSPLALVSKPVPELLARTLSTDAPAVFPGVPYLFDLLVRPDGVAFRPRGLRLCISAGAPLGSGTAAAFHRRYGLPVRAFYGASETGGLAFDASEAGDAAASADGAVGTPLPGVGLALRGSERRIVARSAAVAAGYVPDGASDSGFCDREFATNDAGRFDEHGRLHLTGRLDQRVCIAGRKVDPQEIECALRGLSGVCEAHVGSVADERRGRSLVAYLVATSGVTRSSVLSQLRSKLAPWKLPRDVVFLERLPRTARGKVDRRLLPLRSAGR